jgi:tRNA(Ile)-lysidine synthase
VKTYIVAVSGGVDSVVLLDMLVNTALIGKNNRLIVAHFDHGIRPDSSADAQFVAALAQQYGLGFETKREELGPHASEEKARQHRYAFLQSLAQKYDATIMTAHHADDVVETIAINMIRGTGWRGLAVLDTPAIERPLLQHRKSDLLTYAKTHRLVWHEDSTNSSDAYLRNRVRRQLASLDQDTHQLLRMYHTRQVYLKNHIDEEVARIIPKEHEYSRYLFANMNTSAALELLRAVFTTHTGVSPTIPQRQLALHAIKVAQSGKKHAVGGQIHLVFNRRGFIVESGSGVVS